MKLTQELAQYIQSMTKGERRIFKQQIKIQKGPKKYLDLYSLICDKKRFSDKKAMIQLGMASNPQNYYNLKAYLLRFLLKCAVLDASHKRTNPKLEKRLIHIKILIEKQVYGLAKSLLVPLLHQFHQTERFVHSIEAAGLYLKVLNELNETEEIAEALAYRNNALELLNNWLQFDSILEPVRRLGLDFRTLLSPSEEAHIHKLKTHSFFKSSQMAQSVSAQVSFWEMRFVFAITRGDFATAYEINRTLLSLFDTYPFLQQTQFECFIAVVAHGGKLEIILNQFNAYSATSLRLAQLQIKEDLFSNFILVHRMRLTLQRVGERGAVEPAVVNTLSQALANQDSSIPLSLRAAAYFELARYLFLSGNPRSAVAWTNRLLNEVPNYQGWNPTARQDLKGYALILNTFIFYELGEIDLLDYYARAGCRYLRRKGIAGEYELFLLKVPQSASKIKNAELPRFWEGLIARKAWGDGTCAARIYFDLMGWVYQKLRPGLIEEVF